jgi:peptidyl-dipeptidase Dcp
MSNKTAINRLILPWSGPYGGVPPWDAADPAAFPEAFAAAIAEREANVQAITANHEAPTFLNTIEALERAGQTQERVTAMFEVLRENISTPEIQAIERTWLPRLSAADDAIIFDRALFERIEAVQRNAAHAALTAEERRLTERVHDDFVRRGARLDADGQARLAAINQQLSSAFTDFRTRILADENTWTHVDRPEDLAGLPESEIHAARTAAEERGLPGTWIILNTRSSVDPLLTFATHRDLRERVWRKFKARGANGDANDTSSILASIVQLRADRARLLGFDSHAHWRMTNTMAKTPEAARRLMLEVWPAAVARVRQEVADMQALVDAEGGSFRLEPWDYLYYAEKVRKARYDLDQTDLKPYFQLDQMVAAAFWSAQQRFGLDFRDITGTVPVFHADVRVFEVTDTASNAHRGLFYLDNFARPGKRSGAWASSYRVQHRLGDGATSIASNNNNFIKAGPGDPVLISLDDATTLFHEFGHALHDFLQDVTHPWLGDTPRDFVEVPSQLNERWLLTPDVLERFARHYETGTPIPAALVDRVQQAHTFNQGYVTVEYLAAALLDMDLHTRADGHFDPAAFERDGLARIGMPAEIALRHRLPHFDHLFGSDGYSAGYYSYLWSDVMAADAWQAFVEAGGPWDPAVAARLRQHLLSNGNTTDRGDAYRLFRGRDASVDALLRDRGLVAAPGR